MKEYIYQIEDDESDESEVFIGIIRKGKELIRCRECKWFDRSDPGGTFWPIIYRCKRVSRLWREPNDYCSSGDRREE